MNEMMAKDDLLKIYDRCEICPRKCKADRNQGKTGFCGVTSKLQVSRAALHMWEEPCISGENGSGTVFFTGCSMGCVFCQNHNISHGVSGKEITIERLVQIFYELKEKGANNINLVTPDHYIPSIAVAIRAAKEQGFSLPFVYNTSSYVRVEMLKQLDGLIDIYLPDLKYYTEKSAAKYSKAGDYFQVAGAAIDEMVRQTGRCFSFDDRGIMQKGVIVRHLLMPEGLIEAKLIVRYLYGRYGDDIYLSLMNQYTPLSDNLTGFQEINRRVSRREYQSLVDYAVNLGVNNGFIQEDGTSEESFIPSFDYEGV